MTSDLTERPAAGIARGAAIVAALTMLSRLFGLVRTLVFSQTVGASCPTWSTNWSSAAR